jgi:hypothetical protein
MTDIPGTGKLSLEQETPKNEKLGPEEVSIRTVNVKQIKKEKTYKPKPEDKLWFNQLRFWVLFGGAGSVFFALLGLFHKQFLWLIPICPIIGALAWFIKKAFRRFNIQSDEYFE